MSEKKMARKQKTYSFPLPVGDWIHNLFETHKDALCLLGINSEAKLMEVLAKNGEQVFLDLLEALREKRKSRVT